MAGGGVVVPSLGHAVCWDREGGDFSVPICVSKALPSFHVPATTFGFLFFCLTCAAFVTLLCCCWLHFFLDNVVSKQTPDYTQLFFSFSRAAVACGPHRSLLGSFVSCSARLGWKQENHHVRVMLSTQTPVRLSTADFGILRWRCSVLGLATLSLSLRLSPHLTYLERVPRIPKTQLDVCQQCCAIGHR